MELTLLLQVLQISQRLATMRTVEPLLTCVVDEAIRLVGAERGYLILANAHGAPDFRVQRDQQGQDTHYGLDQISTTIFQKVMTTHEPLVLTDASTDTNFSVAQSVQNLRLRSLMCAPLLVQGNAIGALYVENRSLRGRFKDANLIPLGLFANQAAVAIANATLHEALEAKVAERTASLQTALAQLTAEMVERQRIEQDLRRLASYDTLTGALNRRCFYEQGQAQLTLAVERRLPLAVLLFDLDRFKQINDHHGHVAGDIILRHFASLCQSNAPDGVLFGRLGGEEFAMLLPGNDDKIATRIAERIRSACAEMVTTVNQQPVRVTVSIGVVTMARTSLTLDLLLDRADQAMYISKHRGGNCVTTYTRQRSELSVNACAQPALVMA